MEFSNQQWLPCKISCFRVSSEIPLPSLLWAGNMWARREELSSLRPAKAAERSKTLTSPPQPLLAPAKFKAGLNFHLVNSFVNRPGGNSVSVNISSLVLLALEEATWWQLRLCLSILNTCIMKWKQWICATYIKREGSFQMLQRGFPKSWNISQLGRGRARRQAVWSECGDVNVFIHSLSSALCSLDHERGEGDLS